jgi:hypothetical protein
MVGLDDGPLAKGSRIPVFAFPEPAVGALGRIARHVTSQDRMPLGEPRRPDGIDVEAAEAIIEQALRARPEGTMLPLRAAEGLLRAYGVSVSAGRAVTSEDAAVDAANEELGYPVALKANGIVRRGRSERAGVALDLHDAAEVRRAWQGITEELGAAAMVEAVVQAMAPPGAELRVAVERTLSSARAHLRPGRGAGRRHRRPFPASCRSARGRRRSSRRHAGRAGRRPRVNGASTSWNGSVGWLTRSRSSTGW